MRKILYDFLWISVFFILIWACKDKAQSDDILLRNVSAEVNVNSVVKLSDMLSKHCRLIPLETTSESLVGMVNKVIKHRNKYYVSSANRICIFDHEGHFLSSLNHRGRGVGEYPELCDFDVCTNGDNTEVWICYAYKILIYDAVSAKHLRDINYKPFVHKFANLGNGRLLLMTGLEKNLITMADTLGNTFESVLEKKPTNVMFKAIQFYPFGDKLVYQMDMSSSCMVYDKVEDRFIEQELIEKDANVLTGAIYDEMFREKAEEAWRDVRKYVLVFSFASFNNKTIACLSKGNTSMLSVVDMKTGEAKTVEYEPDSDKIINDLFGLQDYSYFHTFKFASSDDHSLIMTGSASALVEARDKQQHAVLPIQLSQLKEEDNPVLIEFQAY